MLFQAVWLRSHPRQAFTSFWTHAQRYSLPSYPLYLLWQHLSEVSQEACTLYSTDPFCRLTGAFLVCLGEVRTQRSKRDYPGQNLSTFLLRASVTPFTPFFNDEVLWVICFFCCSWVSLFLLSHFIIEEWCEGGGNMGT